MSLVIDQAGDPVHKPKRRDVFQWDAEVASIFDNMAQRSLPMYAETHRVHASLLRRYAEECMQSYRVGTHDHVTVADIGASTGAFIKTLCHVYGCDVKTGVEHLDVVAFDNSPHMIDDLHTKLPWVHAIEHDITKGFSSIDINFDFVNLSYVLQFLKDGTRLPVLKSIAGRMNHGGVLFLSHKESIPNVESERMFQDEYIQFRRDNGYSNEEIEQKTRALRNSMWVDSFDFTKELLEHAGFVGVQPTTRWLNFSSLMAYKK
jgi:tRNA (cmo5U34)-methyltransferase